MNVNNINNANTSFGLLYYEPGFLIERHRKILDPMFAKLANIGKKVDIYVKSSSPNAIPPLIEIATCAPKSCWNIAGDPTRVEAYIPTVGADAEVQSKILSETSKIAQKSLEQVKLLKHPCIHG